MYCTKCGANIVSHSLFCNKCGARLIYNNNESIIMTGLCNRIKCPLFVQSGSALLTNKRFIYLNNSLTKIMAGAFSNLTQGSFDLEIPLSSISHIEDGRQGISKTIIINTTDGKRYKFYVTHREEWKTNLQNAINNCFS